MVGYSDKAATYASAEQMFLAHLVHCLAPWYRRLEQSVDANLLTKKDRKDGHYACFVDAGILRGSLEVTKDFLLGLVNGGLMTPNEGRSKLDLNPDEDPASDKLRIPANITGSVPDADKEKGGGMNNLKAISIGETDIRVGNYMVLFGGRDLVGEFFTKNTKFDSRYTDLGVLYVDFEHGQDPGWNRE